jgi:hypothetical protein
LTEFALFQFLFCTKERFQNKEISYFKNPIFKNPSLLSKNSDKSLSGFLCEGKTGIFVPINRMPAADPKELQSPTAIGLRYGPAANPHYLSNASL